MAIAFPIAAAALALAGTGAEMAARKKVRRKTNEAFDTDAARKRVLQGQASKAWWENAAQAGAAPQTAMVEEGKNKYVNLAQQLGANSALAETAPVMQANETKNVDDKVQDYKGKQANIQGTLYGYGGERAMRNLIRNLKAEQELNRTSNFAQGWQNVLGANLNDAAHSADALQAAGQGLGGAASLLGTVGMLGSLGSLAGNAGASAMAAPDMTNYSAKAFSGEFNPEMGPSRLRMTPWQTAPNYASAFGYGPVRY